MKISLAETLARASSLAVGVAMDSAKMLVLLFSVSGAAIATIYVGWILALAHCRWSPWLRQRIPAALLGGAVLGLALLEGAAVPPPVRIAPLACAAIISIWIVKRRTHFLRSGQAPAANLREDG